jgi:ubiquinone/menaquinone biosynthesis C-methylase UbiE
MVEQVKAFQALEAQKDPASPWARLEVSVLDAMNLQGIADASLSHVTAGWVYFMTSDPQKCLSESKRVLKPEGVLSLSSWKGSQWMDLMQLASQVRPQSKMPMLPEAWASISSVQAQLEHAGFQDVESHEVPVQMTFASYDALADLLLTKIPHMIALLKDFSAEEKAELRRIVISSAQEMAPSEPHVLDGVAIVALGRK